MATETRGCRAEELEAVIALANRVFRPDGGWEMGSGFPLLFCPENLEGLRIVVEESGPVAHVGICIRDASILGARLRVASIGAVCTDPDFRGRGHASALMADARRFAREQGVSLMLISGGRGLYHRLGYVNVGRFDRYSLTAEQLHGTGAPGVELTGYRDEDLAEIAALHQAEPVRFLRSAGDWKRLLAAGLLMCVPSDLLPIRQDGHLAAYVAVQRPRRDEKATGAVKVQELGGSRTAILDALPDLLDRYAAPAVEITVRPEDQEMRVLARRHGWTPRRTAFPGTLGVIDPPALLAALRPVLEERAEAAAALRITATEAGAAFELGGEGYEAAAPGPLAALLFGGETEEARAVPPRSGSLGQLLDTVFPLPLLWYGYNYV